MNEAVKFTHDDPRGKYEKNDTGTMVAVVRDYTNRVIGVVRLTDNSYVEAVLADLEYSGE